MLFKGIGKLSKILDEKQCSLLLQIGNLINICFSLNL